MTRPRPAPPARPLAAWVALCAAALLGACGDSATGPRACTVRLASGCWTFLGLDGEWITALAQTPWGVYAETHDDGVFRLVGTSWQSLGLDHAIVSSLLFVPGPTPRILAGVMPSGNEQTDAAVFASEDGGRTWLPWDGGLAIRNGRRAWAYSLAIDPGDPNRLYMGESYPILRSRDGGISWEFVYLTQDDQGQGVHAILVSPQRDGHVWAAGGTALFTAFVVRSADWGNTWEFADPTPTLENTVQALAVDPSHSDRLWAGLSGVFGGVVRSEDAGRTWAYVLGPRAGGWVYALMLLNGALYAVSSDNFRQSPTMSALTLADLGLYRTRDGGETWDTLPVPEGAGGGQTIALDSEGRLLIGTRLGTRGTGVWRLKP